MHWYTFHNQTQIFLHTATAAYLSQGNYHQSHPCFSFLLLSSSHKFSFSEILKCMQTKNIPRTSTTIICTHVFLYFCYQSSCSTTYVGPHQDNAIDHSNAVQACPLLQISFPYVDPNKTTQIPTSPQDNHHLCHRLHVHLPPRDNDVHPSRCQTPKGISTTTNWWPHWCEFEGSNDASRQMCFKEIPW